MLSLLDKLERKARDNEYKAWQQVVNELKVLGIDINSQDKLNGLLVTWGVRQVELRKAMDR